MKKFLAMILALAMVFALAACGAPKEEAPAPTQEPVEEAPQETESVPEEEAAEPEEAAEKADVKIAVLNGPTALGALHLMKLAETGETPDNYEFTLAGSPDEILGNIIKGEFDIAAVPANVASVLYNKTEGAVQMLAVNTLGVLYCVETGNEINSVADLKGKTVYSVGKGATPEYIFNYLLTANGLDPAADLTVEYKSEAAEAAAILSENGGVAVLPQPFVTAVLAKNPDARVALSFNDEWDKLGEESAITTGCVIVQKKFAEENPEAVERFMAAYEESVNYTNSEETLPEAAKLAVEYGVIPAEPVAVKAIPQCAIVFKAGEEMQTMASAFLQILYDANPAAVGGKMPAEDFYYNAK